jgi:hypothetical protein
MKDFFLFTISIHQRLMDLNKPDHGRRIFGEGHVALIGRLRSAALCTDCVGPVTTLLTR